MNLHPSEIYNHLETRRIATRCSIGCLVAGALLIGLTGCIRQNLKPLTLFSGLVVLWSGRQSRHLVQVEDDILTDFRDISVQSRQNRIFDLMKPTIEIYNSELNQVFEGEIFNSEPNQVFDWSLFETCPDLYVHPAYVGATGSGKSSLAEWLCRRLTGRTVVIAPHWKPGDFQGLVSHAKGRLYGTKDPETVKFDELFDPQHNFTAMTVIATIFNEMDCRYSRRLNGLNDFDQVNVIIDECLSILDEIKQFMDYIRPLLREARKVGIRLHLLLQDDNVKSLKIEGQGAIRKNLTYIRLGDFATGHCKSLKNSELVEWLNRQSRPCMVEDLAAIVPDLTPSIEPVKDLLPDQFEKVWSFVLSKGCPQTASQVKSGLRSCRDLTCDEIRQVFKNLSDRGYGHLLEDGTLSPG